MPENTEHTSPSGFTFTLRPTALVPERLRRPAAAKLMELGKAFAAANPSDGTTPKPETDGAEMAEVASAKAALDSLSMEELARADELNDLMALALIIKWSHPAPVSMEALLDLPSQDYNAIRTAVAPHVTGMFPDFSPTPEPGTPTTP